MSNKVQQPCLAILVVFALVACSSGSDREAAAKQKFQSIPVITGSTEVVVISGISGGASDTCYGGYVEALNGTYKSQEDVINLYSQYAQNNHWTLINTDFSAGVHYFRDDNDDAFAISITFMKPRGPFELYPSSIDQKAIDWALGRFNTVYSLEVVYYPGWKDC